MNILFRVDDIYLNGNEFEQQLFCIFEQYDIPINIGVIPFDQNASPFIPLNASHALPQNIKVCLHGNTHQKNGGKGEFDGLDFEFQSSLIRSGKALLEARLGKSIITFIPPWNAYDSNTLLACATNGIDILSCGYKQIGIAGNQVKEINVSVEHFHIFKSQFFKALSNLFRNRKDLLIIVLFHPYNFTEVTTSHFRGKEKRFEFNLTLLEHTLSKLIENRHTFISFDQLKGKNLSPAYPILNKIFHWLFGQKFIVYKQNL